MDGKLFSSINRKKGLGLVKKINQHTKHHIQTNDHAFYVIALTTCLNNLPNKIMFIFPIDLQIPLQSSHLYVPDVADVLFKQTIVE